MKKICLSREEVASLYKSGDSIHRIAKHFAVSIKPIQRILREENIEMRNSGARKGCTTWIKGKRIAIARLDHDQIVELYSKGVGSHEIAKAMKTSQPQIKFILSSRGIKMRRGRKKRGLASEIWREKNPRWKGGKSLDRERYETPQYREWRKSVLSRSTCCEICASEKDLIAHHRQSFSRYVHLRFEETNGMVVCKTCHKKIHSKKKSQID